jgi:hypothetical protein
VWQTRLLPTAIEVLVKVSVKSVWLGLSRSKVTPFQARDGESPNGCHE